MNNPQGADRGSAVELPVSVSQLDMVFQYPIEIVVQDARTLAALIPCAAYSSGLDTANLALRMAQASLSALIYRHYFSLPRILNIFF